MAQPLAWPSLQPRQIWEKKFWLNSLVLRSGLRAGAGGQRLTKNKIHETSRKRVSFSKQVRDGPPFVGYVGGFPLPVCQPSHGRQCGRKLLPGWRRCGTWRPAWGLERQVPLSRSWGWASPHCSHGLASSGGPDFGDCWLPPVVHGAQGAGLSATLVMLVVTCRTPDLHVFLFLSQAVHSLKKENTSLLCL